MAAFACSFLVAPRDQCIHILLMDATNSKPARDKGNGQYVHTHFEAVCTCGHTLGRHSANAVAGVRECFADDCACMRYRKVRIKK